MPKVQNDELSPRRTVVLAALLPILPIVGLLGMRWDKPKFLSRMTGPDELLVGGLLTLLLAAVGLLWMISTIRVVGEDRCWTWWITVAPAVMITGVILYLTVPGS